MTSSIIGIDTTTKERVEIPKSSRKQGLYIIGATGTGKSGIFENLCFDDGKQGTGFCVIDPHGQLIEHVIARIPASREKDVILLDINDFLFPFGLNLFVCTNLSDPVKFQQTVDRVLHVFEKLLGVSQDTPLILEYLYNCTSVLVCNPGYTMADIPLLLTDEQCRRKLVANVTDIDVVGFWKQHELKNPSIQSDHISSALRRVKQFLQPLSRPIVGQSVSTINLQKIMDEGKILLIKLDVLQLEAITHLIGSLLIALFINAAPARTNRNLFNIYVDEFHRFATKDFATLFAEARKFGIGTTIAHQFRDQLDRDNGGATLTAANLVVFRVSNKDADEVAGQFNTTPLPSPNQTQQKPKRAITSKPVEKFKEGYQHDNPRVNELVEKYLTPLFDLMETYKRDGVNTSLLEWRWKTINLFLVNAMNGQLLPVSQDQRTLLHSLVRMQCTDLFSSFDPLDGMMRLSPADQDRLALFDAFVQTYQGNGQFPDETIEDYKADRRYFHLWKLFQTTYENAIHNNILVSQYPLTEREKQFKHVMFTDRKPLKEELEKQYQEKQQNQPSASVGFRTPYYVKRETQAIIAEANLEKWRQLQMDLVALLPTFKEIEALFHDGLQDIADRVMQGRIVKAIKLAEDDVARIQEVLAEWDEVAQLLHAKPMEFSTGEYEDVPVPRTYADMKNEIANALVGLPNFTAKVKMVVNVGTIEQIVEHKIQTLKPGTGLYGKALQDRIARIQAQNRTDGYTRPRQAVEDDITKRQSQCSQQAQQQQQPPQQPPRRKQILVCQKCGASNQPDAKFCNQCRSPI